MDNLPKGWKIVDWSDVTTKIGDIDHKMPKETTDGYPYISPRDFGPNNKIDFLGAKKISKKDYVELSRKIKPEKGDIIFARYGTIGENRFVEEGIDFLASYSCAIIKHNLSKVLPEFSFYYSISPQVKIEIEKYINRATQPNIGIQSISKFLFPLPPLSEQTRIVTKLDDLFVRINKSIALLEENIKHTKALMASVLEEVFGNGNSWKREPLNKVAKVERGKSKHRPRNDARLFSGIYPFVQTGDVRSADKYIEKYEVCYSEFGLKQSKLWGKGTICLTIAANIGDVAILGFDSCFPDSVVGITPKEMNNEFLFYYLKTLQLQLDKKANSAAQKNINLKILSEIDVPVPPIKMQNSIAKWFTSLEEKQFKIISTQQSKLVYLKALKSSLLDRAFKGEL